MAESLDSVSEMIEVAVGKSRRLKEGVLKAEWEKIVGKICEKCQPDYIKDEILYIRAESPVFIHHLNAEKIKYIQKVNDYFGEKVIKDIEIRTGKLDENRAEYLVRSSEVGAVQEEKQEEVLEIPKSEAEVREDLHLSQEEKFDLGFMQKVAYLQKIAMEREKYLLSQGYKKCKVCGMLYEGEEDFCKVCIDSGKAKKYLKARGVKFEDSELAKEKE